MNLLVGSGLFVIASLIPARASADGPADLTTGLLDRDADVRASAAKRIGASELVAASEAVPVLVEALDDEAPAVVKAAEDAIVGLATRAAPTVLKELSEAPLVDGDGGMGDVIVALGAAFTPQDVAIGLTRGTRADRRVAWLAAAVVFTGGSDDEWSAKSRLRMASLETRSAIAEEKATAAAAVAFIAYRIALTRAWARGGELASLSLAGGPRTLAALVAAPTARNRAALAGHFVAVTGVGDATVVASLKASRIPGAKELPTGPGPLQVARTAESSIAALARLSLAFPEATVALDALSDEEFDSYENAISVAGGASYLARRALVSSSVTSSETRAGWAAAAVREGARNVELVSILVESATRDARGYEGRHATTTALALGRLGPLAVGAVGPLEKQLQMRRLERSTRIRLAAALLGVRPGSDPAQQTLMEDAHASSPASKLTESQRAEWRRDGSDAALALARAGKGAGAASVLGKYLLPHADSQKSGDAFEEHLRIEACALGLGRLAADAGIDGLHALLGLLTTKLPGEGTDETAPVLASNGPHSCATFLLRAAALRSIGAFGSAAAASRDRLEPFLESSDRRLRYVAVQALRRIGAVKPVR